MASVCTFYLQSHSTIKSLAWFLLTLQSVIELALKTTACILLQTSYSDEIHFLLQRESIICPSRLSSGMRKEKQQKKELVTNTASLTQDSSFQHRNDRSCSDIDTCSPSSSTVTPYCSPSSFLATWNCHEGYTIHLPARHPK